MEHATYQMLWYCVMGLVIICYTILDGFDLGVGSLHLLAKGDTNRRIFLNSIGPVWDGNEVWLVVLVGGMFAGFPEVYATVLSALYPFIMLFIFALMFRAVAIEFRSKRQSFFWRYTWDGVFSLMSIYLAFSYGLLLGNFAQGIPIDTNGVYVGSFFHFFQPYPLIVGLTSFTLLAMHGCIYLIMKTEGEIHDRLKRWLNPLIILFIFSFIILTISTLFYLPNMTERMRQYPLLFFFPLVTFLAIINICVQANRGNEGWAFISSSISIASLFLLFGLGTFPYLVHSSVDPSHSLTVFNSSSSQKTLSILMTIVLIGIPLVLGYGYWVYYIFKGKVKIDHMSY
jgi:cytochrome bd ubiquinol oxidase subunit II